MLSKLLILLPLLAIFAIAAPVPEAMPEGLSDIEKRDWCDLNADRANLQLCKSELGATVGIGGYSSLG